MKYKNESRKKFEEALSEAWKYIGPNDFTLNTEGYYVDKEIQHMWEGWFLRFQATYELPKPKPRYHIEYLESEHECTCGGLCVYILIWIQDLQRWRSCCREGSCVFV